MLDCVMSCCTTIMCSGWIDQHTGQPARGQFNSVIYCAVSSTAMTRASWFFLNGLSSGHRRGVFTNCANEPLLDLSFCFILSLNWLDSLCILFIWMLFCCCLVVSKESPWHSPVWWCMAIAVIFILLMKQPRQEAVGNGNVCLVFHLFQVFKLNCCFQVVPFLFKEISSLFSWSFWVDAIFGEGFHWVQSCQSAVAQRVSWLSSFALLFSQWF